MRLLCPFKIKSLLVQGESIPPSPDLSRDALVRRAVFAKKKKKNRTKQVGPF